MSFQTTIILVCAIEAVIGVGLAWFFYRVWTRKKSVSHNSVDVPQPQPQHSENLNLLNELARLIVEHTRSVEVFQRAIEDLAIQQSPKPSGGTVVDSHIQLMRDANLRFDESAEDRSAELSRAVDTQPAVFKEVSTTFADHRQRTNTFDKVLERVPPGQSALELRQVTSESLRSVLETKESLEGRLADAHKKIEQQAAKLEAAEHDARIDSLTRLPNRRSLDGHLKSVHSLFERQRVTYSLLMFDIDKFKLFNDTYGHAAGDAVLQVTAKLLAAQLRPSDGVFRMGGEEFVMVLSATGLRQAKIVAECARNRIEASVVYFDGRDLHVKTSVGVAQVEEGSSIEDVMKQADAALYAAKRAGGNCVELAPPINANFEQTAPEACV